MTDLITLYINTDASDNWEYTVSECLCGVMHVLHKDLLLSGTANWVCSVCNEGLIEWNAASYPIDTEKEIDGQGY